VEVGQEGSAVGGASQLLLLLFETSFESKKSSGRSDRSSNPQSKYD